jgi:siroheme synthase (precorrin-2 oxidase/ferrochelatase)
MTTTTQNSLFPIFLKLEQLHVLIVGGGFVGMEKISAILNNSPLTKVTLVGEKISNEIKEFVRSFENITLIERVFEENDLLNKDLVILKR